ncbi:hypothetical protein L873DRAFT_1843051 [Choiromyces venosus 120613-1]|uniref:Uncharacterized protein n=1 Tax=Choiromyces venosus 120613-1 TaxID=1336337 RepID=A0A3N4JQ87_9PEZI|nr:hypothetical protein L873DRAFT_1843051 [Choiromyces venosus 120613-1]
MDEAERENVVNLDRTRHKTTSKEFPAQSYLILLIINALIYSRLNHLITSIALSPTETSIPTQLDPQTHLSLPYLHKSISTPLTYSISILPCKAHKNPSLHSEKQLFSAFSIGKDLALSQRLYSYSHSPANPDDSEVEDEGAQRASTSRVAYLQATQTAIEGALRPEHFPEFTITLLSITTTPAPHQSPNVQETYDSLKNIYLATLPKGTNPKILLRGEKLVRTLAMETYLASIGVHLLPQEPPLPPAAPSEGQPIPIKESIEKMRTYANVDSHVTLPPRMKNVLDAWTLGQDPWEPGAELGVAGGGSEVKVAAAGGGGGRRVLSRWQPKLQQLKL